MTRFVKRYMEGLVVNDDVTSTVDKIWMKFDSDKSGQLSRKETFRFVNFFLAGKGKP
jgi:hypothetical protein